MNTSNASESHAEQPDSGGSEQARPYDLKLEAQLSGYQPANSESDDGTDHAIATEAKRKKVVVIAFHGMGEHLQMSALQDVFFQLTRALNLEGHKYSPRSFVSNGQAYTEIKVSTPDTDYYLSEAYYSPYFKGLTNVVDVFRFLGSAAIKALSVKNRVLRRTICKEQVEFQPVRGTTIRLWLALLVLLSLIGINAHFATTVAQGLTGLSGSEITPAQAAGAWVMFALVVLAGLLAVLLKLSSKTKSPVISTITYAFFILFCWCFPLGGLLILLKNFDGVLGDFLSTAPGGHWGVGLAGGAFAVTSAFIRSFLDGYVGDVTAYIGGYASSKFFRARRDISERMDRVLNATTEKKCDHLVIYAHSLGTVVAYDALNRFILKLESEKPKAQIPRVKERISFLTYGSPLNKIAYLFRSESGTQDIIRNDLLASRYPITCPMRFEALGLEFRWTNVWAKFDIVAGSLKYFHDESQLTGRVRNVLDEDNIVPLACHSQYSDHNTLKEELKLLIDPNLSPADRDTLFSK